jgi:hypothetical protein
MFHSLWTSYVFELVTGFAEQLQIVTTGNDSIITNSLFKIRYGLH